MKYPEMFDIKKIFPCVVKVIGLCHADALLIKPSDETYEKISIDAFYRRNRQNRNKGSYFFMTEYFKQIEKIIKAFYPNGDPFGEPIFDDLECLWPKQFRPVMFQLNFLPGFYFLIAPNTNGNPELEQEYKERFEEYQNRQNHSLEVKEI